MRTQKVLSILVMMVLNMSVVCAQSLPNADESAPVSDILSVLDTIESNESSETLSPEEARTQNMLYRLSQARRLLTTVRSDGFRTQGEMRRQDFNRLTEDRSPLSDRRYKIYDRRQTAATTQARRGASYRTGTTPANIAQIDRSLWVKPRSPRTAPTGLLRKRNRQKSHRFW